MRTPQALRNRPWLEPAARAGYVAKGIIYALIGGLAIAQVVESAGSIGGGRNAVQTIGQQPFGQILLVIIGVGLFAYALWRAVQAIFDPEDAQSDTGGTLKRIGYGASGAVHAMLGVAAFQMALGSGGGGSSAQSDWKLLDDADRRCAGADLGRGGGRRVGAAGWPTTPITGASSSPSRRRQRSLSAAHMPSAPIG